jgi:arsenite methyltransferase
VSDVVNTASLSADLEGDTDLICGCVAGAAPAEQIEGWLAAAGFEEIGVTAKPESRELIATWAPGRKIEDFVVSAFIEARKPLLAAGDC